MRNRMKLVGAAALLLTTVDGSAVTVDGPIRTFVSAAQGSDLNDCSLGNPCRNFNRAMQVVRSGGDVVALDSGGYGPLTIDGSVNLIATPSVYAAIMPTTANAVTVAAGSADVIFIEGLTLRGPALYTGINVTAADAIYISRCNISGFAIGIQVSTFGAFSASVSDVVVRENNSVGMYFLSPAADAQKVLIDRCRIEGNDAGVVTNGGVKSTITESVVANNTGGGIFNNAPGSIMVVEGSVVSRNSGYGISSCGPAIMVSDSVIVANGNYGLVNACGNVFNSRGNNTVYGNAAGETSGTITYLTGSQ